MESDENSLRDCLKDAGISVEATDAISNLYNKGKKKEAMDILFKQRCHLLNDVHTCQCRLDRLDYLLYEMKRNLNQEEKYSGTNKK